MKRELVLAPDASAVGHAELIEAEVAFQPIAAARIAPGRSPQRAFALNVERTQIDEAGQVLPQSSQVEASSRRPFFQRAGHLQTQEIRITAKALQHRQRIAYLLMRRQNNRERFLPREALALIQPLQVGGV